ncbi:MAG: IS66 family transposase [Rhabdochlamydiaceae bacterium]
MKEIDPLREIPKDLQRLPWIQAIIQQLEQQARVMQEQSERIQVLEKTNQELRDEINRLKKTPKRPKFRPSGSSRNRGGNSNNALNKGSCGDTEAPKKPVKVKEEVRIAATGVPAGSRFKGYQSYTIQELEITVKEITYQLEVWQAPDGTVIRATLPQGLEGSHFGPQLRSLMHNLYALGMTEPGLFDLSQGCGIDISAAQVHNLLVAEVDDYQKIAEEILSTGLAKAPYIRTDDTGAKHQYKNGYCTHVGGEFFAYYKTTFSKSRDNFLKILLQGKEGYWINHAMIWHLFQSGVDDDLLNSFEEHIGKKYCTPKGMRRLLNQLGIRDKKLHWLCLEAASVGFISETILKRDQVLLSDRAGQFAVFDHAGCWVHMERPLRKLTTATEEAEQELNQVREAIWRLYRKLQEAAMSQEGKEEVHKLYDQLVEMKSISPGINEVIASFIKYRDEMLKALDHPSLPLHNNDSERDIRGMVKRRNISGSTKSEAGKAFRDCLMTLKQTCFRLGISFWSYLTSWFKREPIDLAQVIEDRYRGLSSVA